MNAAARAETHWTIGWRSLVFLLAGSSLACLLFDFYGLCPMRLFTLAVFVPAMIILVAFAVLDRQRGDGRLWSAVLMGLVAGLVAAASYDIFRLPFVFANQWGIASVVPALNLFKVFPQFGAMILSQPLEQASYSLAATLLGWAYHFSNGATLGVMYIAAVGDPKRRHWTWAVLMAVGLEVGMLLTPYAQVFKIPVTPRFILVTLAAHGVFGVCLGLSVKGLAAQATQSGLLRWV